LLQKRERFLNGAGIENYLLKTGVALEKAKKGFAKRRGKRNVDETDDCFGMTETGIHLIDEVFVLETDDFAGLLEFGDDRAEFSLLKGKKFFG
jgi:hypothetical protein